MTPGKEQLQATSIMDYDHEIVREFIAANTIDSGNEVEQAVRFYYAVRDGIRYNPYKFVLSVEGLKASATLSEGDAWCVPKAALLAACCRASGIPARLGYADVRNHLSTARMREAMKTDIFKWHGYTNIYLDGKWVKSTPAFNIELCEKFRLKPLEFDGRNDSIYHPFDLDGNQHMEYLNDRGEFDDVPIKAIQETFAKDMGDFKFPGSSTDFDQDVETETVSTEN